MLFTDGSVHPPSGIGYGACLMVPDENTDIEELKNNVQLKRFEETSSTRLEIETFIWALHEIQHGKVTIYTDSQNIIGLPGRRKRFEERKYCSNRGVLLKNAELYQEFFRLTDKLDCTFVKVKGHRQSKDKNRIDQLFTLVDRASRQTLRSELSAS